MLVLVHTALAFDCSGGDPEVCAAVEALVPQVNALAGDTVLHDAADTRLTPERVYDELLAVRVAAEAGGCAVDGGWLAGVVGGNTWTGVDSEDRHASGKLQIADGRFYGAIEMTTGQEPVGWTWSAFDRAGPSQATRQMGTSQGSGCGRAAGTGSSRRCAPGVTPPRHGTRPTPG
ncbi:MAG: hypothetical protein H6734_11355 [Alphaproteobacteria bacterium]|nr:hypothetical protein [Alphaproteobacteria bacterium]